MAEPLCEFCERPASETRSLTITSSIAICSECVVLCQGALADRSPRRTFVEEIGKLAALTAQEEADVAKRIARGDLNAKTKMVESNLRLVVSVAGHYRRRELPFLNICQEGVLGLVRAAEEFDPRNGVRFSTYATPWVRRSIEHAIAMRQVATHSDPDLRCSFCDKTPSHVKRLIATSTISPQSTPDRHGTSHQAAICDECVVLCTAILDEQPP